MNLKATGVVVRTGSLVLADVPEVRIEAGRALSIVGRVVRASRCSPTRSWVRCRPNWQPKGR